ncbi:MAG: septum formation initiator family protein [Chitinophagales bacterium]
MKRFIKVITNKYLVTGVAFVAWVVYFDQNDWMTLQQRQKELNGVKDNIAYLNNEIARMNAERHGLLTNPNKLETYARENFRMKHDNEDVYVIEK